MEELDFIPLCFFMVGSVYFLAKQVEDFYDVNPLKLLIIVTAYIGILAITIFEFYNGVVKVESLNANLILIVKMLSYLGCWIYSLIIFVEITNEKQKTKKKRYKVNRYGDLILDVNSRVYIFKQVLVYATFVASAMAIITVASILLKGFCFVVKKLMAYFFIALVNYTSWTFFTIILAGALIFYFYRLNQEVKK